MTSTPSYSWPSDLFPPDQVGRWLERSLGFDAGEPIDILYSKNWGVTAVFGSPDHRRVVFKGSKHPSASHGPIVHQFLARVSPGMVPGVVAIHVQDDVAWTLFEVVDGEPLEADLDVSRFVELAVTVARIQIATARAAIPEEIPRWAPASLPDTLDRFSAAVGRNRDDWPSALTPSPRDALARLTAVRPDVETAARELADTGWPDSVDHVDLNVSNAIIDQGRVVVIDWEEALIGFPACSLDRLLQDAREFDGWDGPGRSPTERAVVQAYAEVVDWGAADTRALVIEMAVRLNRVAFAGQALDFSRALGKPDLNPRLAAFCTDQILELWER